jgi:NADPH-dependent ferric siderophore reductase
MTQAETPDAPPVAPARLANEMLADRLGLRALRLRVARTTALTPSCQRLELVGDDLVGFDPQPGQDIMVSLTAGDDRVYRRRYSIRHFDDAEGRVDVDIALHGGGPGMRWATTLEPGELVEGIGPRGKISLQPDAAWHLFVGDDSFAPAALNMAEGLVEGETTVVALEVDGPGHEQPDEIRADVLGPRWVLRQGTLPGDPSVLLAALSTTELPSGRGHAYLGGEHGVVNALRDALLARGMDAESVSAKPYWRLGRQNTAVGEPERN